MSDVATGFVLRAPWSEIDWQTKIWHIPGARRKGRKGKEQPLDVPLVVIEAHSSRRSRSKNVSARPILCFLCHRIKTFHSVT
jgi:hypothetical protein